MNPVFRPGTENLLEVDIQLADDYAEIVPFLNGTARYNILFKARECEVGEKFTETYECLTCDQYTYSFTPLKEPSACPPCPQYGDCLDGNLYPEPGYVRMTDTSEVFVRCPNEFACLAGNLQNKLKNCAPDYQGVMCGQC